MMGMCVLVMSCILIVMSRRVKATASVFKYRFVFFVLLFKIMVLMFEFGKYMLVVNELWILNWVLG